jgi:hypothetical protein
LPFTFGLRHHAQIGGKKHRLAARLAVGVAAVLFVSTPVVLTTLPAAAVQAAPTCLPPDNPPPRVPSFAATDVVPGSCAPSVALTANASPEPVRVGRTVTVKGRLTRANWDLYANPQQGYAGQLVLLQRRTSTGTYHTLKSVRTDRRGYVRTGVRVLSGTRCYRWVFPENATTQGRHSGGDCARAH